MEYSRSLTVVVGLICSLAVVTGAQERPSPTPAQDALSSRPADIDTILQTTGSVSFREAPLAEVILILSEQWSVNIIASSNITGEVSGSFQQETLQRILDSLLTAAGYKYQKIGNNLVILIGEETDARGQLDFAVEVVPLPVTDPAKLTELLEALKTQMSADGKLLPVQASGKLTIQDTPTKIAAVKQLMAELMRPQHVAAYNTQQSSDSTPPATPQPTASNSPLANIPGLSGIPGISELPGMASAAAASNEATVSLGPHAEKSIELRPQYVAATDLADPLGLLAGKENVAVVEKENLIVVFGNAQTHTRARELFLRLDQPRKQVRITGYIYDVDLGELERLGVDFNYQTMSQGLDSNGVPRNLALSQGGLLTPAPPNNASTIVTGLVEDAATATATAAGGATAQAAAAPAGGQFLFRTLHNKFELQSLVQALDQTEGSRLLADPHVTVTDRNTASLGIVTKIPVQQLTQTQQGGNIASTSFEEAGIKLEVTPRIADDGSIELTVAPEFSTLSGFQNGNPIIDTRQASTVVRVTHGQPLVIGGLRSKSTVETVRGVPGLMNLKFIGKLFRMHDTEVRESELIVLMMPEIVDFCNTGLPREEHALEVTRNQLSRVQTAVDGAFMCDCGDKFCPHHHPRPRIHNGMQDIGLVGAVDPIFVTPGSFQTVPPQDSIGLPAGPDIGVAPELSLGSPTFHTAGFARVPIPKQPGAAVPQNSVAEPIGPPERQQWP